MNKTTFDQLMAIRDSGACNMLDCRAVQRIAFDNEFFDLVLYIEDDPKRYFHFIMTGEE